MDADFIGFDPGDKPIDVKIDYQPPSSPLAVAEEDPIRLDVYEMHVRGYPPLAILRRLQNQYPVLKLTVVKQIIADEREKRAQAREETGPLSLQDAIEYYQRMKIEAEERSKYSDDKAAPEFLKIAMECQNRLDKLMGLEGEKAGRLPGDAEFEGLAIYKVKSRVIRDDQTALASGDDDRSSNS